MEKVKLKIKWDKEALIELTELYEYIKIDSAQNAKKVRAAIVEKVKEIVLYPFRYTKDMYKINNDGSYRYFELYH